MARRFVSCLDAVMDFGWLGLQHRSEVLPRLANSRGAGQHTSPIDPLLVLARFISDDVNQRCALRVASNVAEDILLSPKNKQHHNS